MQTSVRRHESDTHSIAVPCGGDRQSSAAERETVCVYHGNKQFIVSRRKPQGFEIEICSRSTHRDCRWLYVRVQVHRDGASGGRRVAVRDDSVTTCDEDATEVNKTVTFKSRSRAENSGSADACPHATDHCDKPTPKQRQAGKCSVCGSC